MIIAQFTDEKVIPWMHEGISGELVSGKTYDVPENRARFILNKLSRRGVVQLVYSEDPNYKKSKIKESRDLNDRFWFIQIENHNRHNETLKAGNKPYVRPTEAVIDAAEKFGIELLGPWRVNTRNDTPPASNKKDPSVSDNPKDVKVDRIDRLESQFAELQSAVMDIVTHLKKSAVSAEDMDVADVSEQDDLNPITQSEELIQQFKTLPKKQLEPYIKEHAEAIPEWPANAMTAIYDRYEKMFGKPLDLENYK